VVDLESSISGGGALGWRLSAVAPTPSRRSTDRQGSQNLRSFPAPPTLIQSNPVSTFSHSIHTHHVRCQASFLPGPAPLLLSLGPPGMFIPGTRDSFVGGAIETVDGAIGTFQLRNKILTACIVELQGYRSRRRWWYWSAIVPAAQAQPQG
jgi:hypothetical protein